MDLNILKRFKIRMFILWAVISFILVMFVAAFIPGMIANSELNTMIISIILFVYLFMKSKKYGIVYSEKPLRQAMTTSNWIKVLSTAAMLQITATVLGIIILSLFVLIFRDYLENFLFFLNLDETTLKLPFSYYALTFVNLCILAPLWEELFFRGILLRRFLLKWSPQKSIIISSLLFGVIHVNPLTIVFAFFIGCVLGYTYLKSNSILVPMIIHSFSNFLGFLYFCYINRPSSVLPDVEILKTILYTSSVVFVVLFIVLLLVSVKLLKKFRALTFQNKNADFPLE